MEAAPIKAVPIEAAPSTPRLTRIPRVDAPQVVHLVGAGGAGMCALAAVLAGRGWRLSGSDSAGSTVPGIEWSRYSAGHAPENLPDDVSLVVYSAAVPQSNPELAAARGRGVPCLSYPEFLGVFSAAEQAQGRRLAAVAGTHGKSTVTAMIAAIAATAGLAPTAIGGGVPLGQQHGGQCGHGPLLLVEACEYRRHFLNLRPDVAAVLNVEPDHFDCYLDDRQLDAAFEAFCGRARGTLVVNAGCARAARIAGQAAPQRLLTFGWDRGSDLQGLELGNLRGRRTLRISHRAISNRAAGAFDFELQTPGGHQAENALAAAAVALACGIEPAAIAHGLAEFAGLRRRLEIFGQWRGAWVVDDFAHHPTAVRAALATLREMFPERRLVVVFQPHQASRTARLLDEFAFSLQNADKLLVAEIFRAREGPPREGEVTARRLAQRVRETSAVEVADVPGPVGVDGTWRERAAGAGVLPGRWERAEDSNTMTWISWLEANVSPGDVLAVLGAGDIRKLLHELVLGF